MTGSARIVLVATIGLLALLAAPLASASPSTERADRALDRALQRVVDADGGPPGAVAVVQRGNGRVVLEAGVSKVGGKAPARHMHMRLASTSKAFSGATALALVGDGKLALDDTIAEVLPELPPAWGPVTLAQALNHTSGIPTFTTDPDYLTALSATLETGPTDQADLLAYVAEEPLGFTPGTDYRYSNSDNVVVALMVEAVTGSSYRRAMQREVFAPLGLRETSLPKTVAMPSPFIHGYDVAPATQPEDVSEVIDPDWSGASGGMVSTPSDLNGFARGYVGAELFSRKVQRRQLKLVKGSSEPPGPGQNRAGLGIFRYRTDCGTLYGHTGNFPGYTQFFAATRNGKRSVTVSASEQLSPDVKEDVFDLLRAADERGVCAALAR